MKTANDQTRRIFLSAALSDEDPGYPYGTAFVADEIPEWREITLRNLRERRPTVVVNREGAEYLLLPHGRPGLRGWADRVLRRPRAQLYWRHGDHTHGGFEVAVSSETLDSIEREPQLA